MDYEQRAREIIDAHFYQYASSLQKSVYDAIAAALREAWEAGHGDGAQARRVILLKYIAKVESERDAAQAKIERLEDDHAMDLGGISSMEKQLAAAQAENERLRERAYRFVRAQTPYLAVRPHQLLALLTDLESAERDCAALRSDLERLLSEKGFETVARISYDAGGSV